MDFELSQQHREFQQEVRKFAAEIVLPQIAKYEEENTLPRKILREMGEKGFLKAHFSAETGGPGLGTMGYCIFSEEISRAGAGMTHNGHFQSGKMLLECGTPGQKDKYLSKLLTGEYLAATAITEPAVGSSFADMKTTVQKQGNAFIINGIKTLINDAAEADIVSIFAKADSGFSIFIIEKKTPGFKILKKFNPMGLRSSPVYEFELKNCTVSSGQLIGNTGDGLNVFFTAFNFSRLGNASAALGISQAAFDMALDYLKQRKVGSHLAAEFQGLRWIMAEMSTMLEAARLMRDRAATMDDKRMDISLESSRVKLLCVQVANRVTGECIQVTGRYGCLRDNMLEMYMRDARLLGTAGGSLEVMKNNIARRLFGG